MDSPFSISDDKKTVFVIAQKEYFEQECVMRSIGLYVDSFFINFYPHDEFSIKIEINNKNKEEITTDFLKGFMNNLIDTQIRLDVEKEFSAIRDKIVSQAFLSATKK